MADLEKTINPDVSNTNNIATNEAPEINLSEPPQEIQKVDATDATENMSSREVEKSENLWVESWETVISSETSPNESFLVDSPSKEITTENSPIENLDSTSEGKTINTNNFILWEFNDTMTNTTNEHEVNQISEISQNQLLEHPAILDNATNLKSPSLSNLNPEEEQKTKVSQKEKLAQLLKIHESKAQKSWFTKWILSGVALTAILVLASFILAKDQILNLLNDWDVDNHTLSANIVNLNEDQRNNNEDENLSSDENVSNIEEEIENNEDQINDEEDFSENEWDLTEEFEEESYYDEQGYEEDEGLLENEEIENSESIDNETSIDKTIENEEIKNDEPTDETENNELNIEETNENDNTNNKEKAYTITPVLSEEIANWVMPTHCGDLTCYGEDKEFTPCTTFRLSENLDENANRIGKNWVCKYKDPSELVFVEFLDEEDESNQDSNMEDKKITRDVARKSALSQLQTAIVTSQWDKWVWPGMDKGAKEWITMSVIKKEVKEAWMDSIPMDPNIFNINYWLWSNYKNDSAIWEYLYLVAKRNWTQNWWFILMANTEVPWRSNWLVCKDWTWLNKWYIDNETDIAKIQLCTTVTQWNSCEINEWNCTYTSEDELRYIMLY